MLSTSHLRRGTGFETKASRPERRHRTSPVNTAKLRRAHKLGTGKQSPAQKHLARRQRLHDRARKFSDQQVFMEMETWYPNDVTEASPNEQQQQQAWKQHLLLLAAERHILEVPNGEHRW